ncbi:MAG TPA: sporulation protein YjcZ [Firmicutes bacterium]|nr:sporulation protein YjcZ [Bacillota bacterium]
MCNGIGLGSNCAFILVIFILLVIIGGCLCY